MTRFCIALTASQVHRGDGGAHAGSNCDIKRASSGSNASKNDASEPGYDMGHGDTAPGAPQADVAVDMEVDGDSDVLSHGFLLGPHRRGGWSL
jgi:hypothetical protein